MIKMAVRKILKVPMEHQNYVNTKSFMPFHGFGDHINSFNLSQTAFTCSKLTTETLEQGVKYVQS